MYREVKVPILQQSHQEAIVEYLENKFNNNISKLVYLKIMIYLKY